MIKRDIEIIWGMKLIESTPMDGMTANGDRVFGVRMKNMTEADCLGDVRIIFISEEACDQFIGVINKAREMSKTPFQHNTTQD